MLWIDRWIGDGLVMGCVKKIILRRVVWWKSFLKKFLVCWFTMCCDFCVVEKFSKMKFFEEIFVEKVAYNV